ncbi:hypothetical protein FA15DRAFT_704349 [Coprinopsis marcescibilis]|uniref:Uncharacterized protein n=1 Tax=Coprinopsis marcescibilis TaxID=230819 RepID=A0A5C3KVL3_COPMA|nr:hypothetical protein FA15DRAFT_704349 [Coprinopsis marcescibilis]
MAGTIKGELSAEIPEDRLRRAELRRAIEDRIAELEGGIRDLWSQRNALSDISQMPGEILCRIFAFCAQHEPWKGYAWTTKRDLPWFRVTHVSRHWRAVAIACPELWTEIYLTGTPLTQMMVERSKQVPISVEAWCTFSDTAASKKALHDILVKEMHRLKTLRLTSSDSNILDAILTTPLKPVAPTLRDLRIDHCDPHNLLKIPEQLLDEGGAPNLREFSVRGCQFSWTSPIFASLNRFQYLAEGYSQDDTPSTLPSAQGLLQGLSNMGKLVHLNLNITFLDFARLKSKPITLPLLQDLTLTSDLLNIVTLLNHLTLPSVTTLELNGEVSVTESEGRLLQQASELGSALKSLWQPSSPSDSAPTFQTCKIGADIGSPEVIQGWFKTLNEGQSDIIPPNLKISFNIREPLLRILPFEHLRHLHVQVPLLKTEFSALGQLEELESIYLRGEYATKTFVEYMAADPRWNKEGAAGSETTPTYLPSLRHISVTETDFTGDDDMMSIDDLLDFLKMRISLNRPIGYLGLRRCYNVSDGDYRRFVQVLGDGHVDWDWVHEAHPQDVNSEGGSWNGSDG